jgi:hypothetical protein
MGRVGVTREAVQQGRGALEAKRRAASQGTPVRSQHTRSRRSDGERGLEAIGVNPTVTLVANCLGAAAIPGNSTPRTPRFGLLENSPPVSTVVSPGAISAQSRGSRLSMSSSNRPYGLTWSQISGVSAAWRQRRIVARRELSLPMRLRQHRLDHQRVDVDHAVLDQM